MPYRRTGSNLDAPVEVLLVTSRETKRWVLPKGNRSKRYSAHMAAAREAWEEAGVTGSICPTALGSYRYKKRLDSGTFLFADVEVFPLAVIEQHDEWPENHERERRWFSLCDASSHVEEEDLGELMRSFRTSEFADLVGRNVLLDRLQSVREGLRIFHWFHTMFPRHDQFFVAFERHTQTLIAGSDALARLLEGGEQMAQHTRELIEREHEADAITREVLINIRRTFLTPFDRSDITSLISAMDDAIDEMQKTAVAIDLYEVTIFENDMRDLAAIIVDAARILAEAVPLLRSIHANAARLHELTERLVRLEGHADDIAAMGRKKAFKRMGSTNPIGFTMAHEIYNHLERVMDRFEDVANEIDGLVIDHA